MSRALENRLAPFLFDREVFDVHYPVAFGESICESLVVEEATPSANCHPGIKHGFLEKCLLSMEFKKLHLHFANDREEISDSFEQALL